MDRRVWEASGKSRSRPAPGAWDEPPPAGHGHGAGASTLLTASHSCLLRGDSQTQDKHTGPGGAALTLRRMFFNYVYFVTSQIKAGSASD